MTQSQLDPVREHMRSCATCSTASDSSGYCSEGTRLTGVTVDANQWAAEHKKGRHRR